MPNYFAAATTRRKNVMDYDERIVSLPTQHDSFLTCYCKDQAGSGAVSDCAATQGQAHPGRAMESIISISERNATRTSLSYLPSTSERSGNSMLRRVDEKNKTIEKLRLKKITVAKCPSQLSGLAQKNHYAQRVPTVFQKRGGTKHASASVARVRRPQRHSVPTSSCSWLTQVRIT